MEADLGYDLFMRTTKDIKITEKAFNFISMRHISYRNIVPQLKMYDLNITSEPRIKWEC